MKTDNWTHTLTCCLANYTVTADQIKFSLRSDKPMLSIRCPFCEGVTELDVDDVPEDVMTRVCS